MMSSLGIPLVQGLRMLVNGPSGQLVQIPEPDEDCVMEPGQNLRQTLDILAGKVPVSIPELPSRLDALMRPYQKEGFSFLYRITEQGFGACLADDMGLGKTLQAIAWLDTLRRKGRLEGLPALIVAPASLLSNWKEEAQRFAPELILRIMHPSSPDPWQPEKTCAGKTATPSSLRMAWLHARPPWPTCISRPLFWMKPRLLKTQAPPVPAPFVPCMENDA